MISLGGRFLNRSHPLAQGLVGLWLPHLGPTGGTLYDVSGYGNHGTLTNMDPATDWVPGQMGWALKYVTNDYVNCGNACDMASVAVQRSFSLWYRAASTSPTSDQWLLSKSSTVTPYRGFDLKISGAIANDPIDLYLITGSNNWNLGRIARPNDTSWHHLCFVTNGQAIASNWTAYLDGVLMSITASNGGSGHATDLADTTPLQIGARPIGANGCFAGQIGSIAIHDRSIQHSEVLALYQSPLDCGGMLALRRRVYAAAAAPPVGPFRWPWQQRRRRRMAGAR